MKIFYRLVLICCLSFTGIKTSSAHCPNKNEVPGCIDRCQKCQYIGKECFQILVCNPGCNCKKGFYRNQQNECVSEEVCKATANKNSTQCPSKDEVPVNCIDLCQRCEYLGEDCVQVESCTPGCDCKKGFYRNQQDVCVSEAECYGINCRTDEQYYPDIPDCINTCEFYNNPETICPQYFAPRPGCFCKEGLVKREDGKCVTPENCSLPVKCGRNEQYYPDIPDCRNTCENYNNPYAVCPLYLVARPGCFCKEGLVKRNDGICVTPENCSSTECPLLNCLRGCDLDNSKPCPRCVCPGDNPYNCKDDEQYYECTPNCKNTCKNYFNPGIRCKCGEPACFCKEGLLQDGDRCVRPEECKEYKKQEKCRRNEQYYRDIPDCKNTCENYNNPYAVCPRYLVARPGCFCKEGLVKRNDGICVTPENCF